MDIFGLFVVVFVVILLFINEDYFFVKPNYCVDCKYYVLTDNKHMCCKPVDLVTKVVQPTECGEWRAGVDCCCDFKHKAGLWGKLPLFFRGQ